MTFCFIDILNYLRIISPAPALTLNISSIITSKILSDVMCYILFRFSSSLSFCTFLNFIAYYQLDKILHF